MKKSKKVKKNNKKDKNKEYDVIKIDDYQKFIGKKALNRIKKKAESLKDVHIAHINSTYYGGGVAEILSSLTLLMNTLGIKTGWRIIEGSPDFFSITKKMHNALQGGDIHLTKMKKKIYENVIYENSLRNHLDHDIVVVHDPQPLFMIEHYKSKKEHKTPWIWRCHVDLSDPHKKFWKYIKPHIEKYDLIVSSLKRYKKKLKTQQKFIPPALDPFATQNRDLGEKNIRDRFKHHKIPTDKPLVVQVSRFDKWKDPEGVIKAFKIAKKKVDARLVLLGNIATDDPEGQEVYDSLLDEQSDDIIILSVQDSALVNALQRRATVVLQKSIREGFGLTVTEAMWKAKPVIGGNVGGIKVQIKDGENGFLVDSVEETAEKIVYLINNPKKAEEMGKKAKESVKKNYLLTRLLEDHLDLYKELLDKKQG